MFTFLDVVVGAGAYAALSLGVAMVNRFIGRLQLRYGDVRWRAA